MNESMNQSYFFYSFTNDNVKGAETMAQQKREYVRKTAIEIARALQCHVNQNKCRENRLIRNDDQNISTNTI